MKVIIKVIKGPEQGKVFEFTEYDTFLFGRSRKATCSLPKDGYISRNHFLLEINPPDVFLRDLSSMNKTYVNDVPYGGRDKDKDPLGVNNFSLFIEKNMLDRKTFETKIKNQDVIKVGETEMVVTMEGDKIEEELETAELEVLKEYKTIVKSPEEERAARDIIMQILDEVICQGKPKNVPAFPGYEVIKRLGGGGMGDVFLAERIRSSEKVAVKIIKPEKEVTKKDVARFLREMDISKSLRHKNIIKYIEGNYSDGIYYMIMEYVEGTDMQLLVDKEGKMDPILSAKLIIEALDGLQYMHENHTIHRDIKPSNVLLRKKSDSLESVITDFGLAKNIKSSTQITKTGEAAGTLPYMAPEQIVDFKHVKEPADVYSIGGTLYTLCTGCLPHDYPKHLDPVMVQIQEPIVPIEKRINRISEKLAKTINRSMEIDLGKRYKSAEEFRKELEKSI